MNTWCHNTVLKVLHKWRETAKIIGEERDIFYVKLINKPSALFCLTALAGIDITKMTKDEPIQQRMIRVAMQNAIKKQCFQLL